MQRAGGGEGWMTGGPWGVGWAVGVMGLVTPPLAGFGLTLVTILSLSPAVLLCSFIIFAGWFLADLFAEVEGKILSSLRD